MKLRLLHPASAVMATVLLSGCIFSGDGDSQTVRLKSGAYHSDYGAAGRSQGHESELVLEANGKFHFFGIQDTTAWEVTKGNWKSGDGETLILTSSLQRYAHYSYLFDSWDSLPPDTSYLRQISDNAFERLEVSYDSGFYSPVVRWVQYRRFEPQTLSDGQYVFTEVYPDYYDSATLHAGSAYMNLVRNGSYADGRSEDGKPLWDFQSLHWTQLGSFIIVTGANGHNYDSSGTVSAFQLDSNAEFVAQVRAVGRDSFQQWIPEDQSFTNLQHLVTWRRKPQ